MKNLSILGSTGSIGCNVLNIVKMFPKRFSVKALTAKNNIKLLADQITEFYPDIAVVYDEEKAFELKKLLGSDLSIEVLHGQKGYNFAAQYDKSDIVIGAMMGAAGLQPTLSAIDAKKQIALANKETLVMAGQIVMDRAAKNKVNILPIDSEHSAIFQCLSGQRRQDMDKILLTASGGPFLNTPKQEFAHIKPEHALKHPNWDMGKKISIDSATLMNKGLEVIEAKHLFGVSHKDIKVVVHPQSIVHSMVAYKDGSVIAQLGVPDMKGAIAYAMSYPERLNINQPVPDFASMGTLTFQEPDLEKFPCLALAFKACDTGRTMPAVLNAANEVAVEAFLENKIKFLKIPEIIREIMNRHIIVENPAIADILDADQWARIQAVEYIQQKI